VLPDDSMQRAILLVAESQRPDALAAGGLKLQGGSFVDRVVAAAHGFAGGPSAVPAPASYAAPAPGRVVAGSFIEDAGLRIGETGRITGLCHRVLIWITRIAKRHSAL